MTKQNLDDLLERLREQPGLPVFSDAAFELLKDSESRVQAREICFRGLSADPENLKGRLALAKAFYADGMAEFCVRELVEIKRRKQYPSLQRLLDAFGSLARIYDSSAEAATEDEVIGEVDFDAELSEVLEEIDDE